MPKSPKQKPTINKYDIYVRTRDHVRIKAIADERIADMDSVDFDQPGKLEDFTIMVAKKLAPNHKYYRAMVESNAPTKH